MRNLRTNGHFETPHGSELPLTAVAWDPTSENSQICAFGPTESNPVVEIRKRVPGTALRDSDGLNGSPDQAGFSLLTSWDTPCPLPDLACDQILSLQYFSDIGIVCLVLAGGDLVIVRESPLPGEERIEIVGSVDVGISAALWSHDEELLAIVTRSSTLLYMTRDFDQVFEVILTSEDLKASKHVSVGWGKKETQFQGKRAKALRDPTMPETVDEGKPSPFEDGRTTISWRGDGAFVAINSVVSNDRRAIRVYSREGTLDSVSEPVDGLESALSWRPAGNLVASIQRLDTRVDVIFFERNGLRHGQFALRLSKEEIENRASRILLSWNIDSTVLAVSMLDRVQLWTMGNYHYYLKKDISLPGNSVAPCALRWHPEKPLKLLLEDGDCSTALEWTFNVSRGSPIPPYDFGTTAVIDGCSIKLTPLRLAGVPPPMSLFELTVDKCIVDCAISPRKQRIAILTNEMIHHYEWDLSKTPVSLPALTDGVALAKLEPHVVSRQIIFLDDDRLCVLGSTSLRESFIQCLIVDPKGHLTVREPRIRLNSSIPYIFTDTKHERLWWFEKEMLHFLDSRFQKGESIEPRGHGISSLSLMQTEAVNLNSFIETSPGSEVTDVNEQYVLFSLTKQGHLYVGSRRISTNCTSFILSSNHLIFTTSQHLLKFAHLSTPDGLEVPGDTPEEDERCRSIERGARIINVMPSVYAVVLQMPRGNLETIYPRALVLAGIRRHIDDKDYRKAYLACHNHQVDMNILYDYRPEQFMSSLPLFVNQLSKGDRVDDFISKLKDEDVTKTLYRDTLQMSKKPTAAAGDASDSGALKPNGVPVKSKDSDKVNKVCTALLSNLDPSMHLQSIITAHVCKQPPDLEAGLKLVSDLLKSSPSDAESAISHLCFLTDANTLYTASLLLHNLELTLLVAQQSQRDPREYIPYLRHLHSLPPLRRAFEIDDSLSQHAKALHSLHALSAHDEAERYTLKHSLFTTALNLYRYSPPHIATYTRHYAAYLSSTSQTLRAALLYESLNDFMEAYPLYALAHRWRESLSSAQLASLPAPQLRAHAESLITSLTEESHDYASASTIAADHLHDIPQAATLLCRGTFFADAIRLLALHNLRSSIPTIIDPSLAHHFADTTDLLADCRAQLAAQVPRIAELRRKKAEDPLAFFGGDPSAANTEGDIPDNLSLAPTDASTRTGAGGTLVTRYTAGSRATSSKSKRREERKKARGKRGSVYEEGYLIGSVARLVVRVNEVGGEVERVVEGCWRRGMRERAEALEGAMTGTVRSVEEGVAGVWEGEGEGEGALRERVGDGNGEGARARPAGAEGVQWDAEMGAEEMPKRPEVRPWRGSGILD